MKPDWDRLMEEFKGSETALIADVDCTAAGEELCSMAGVEGYPTLKYGDPDNLQEYEGGHEYDDLLEFAHENLGPVCAVTSIENCDEDQKAKIDAFLALGLDKLEEKMKEIKDGVKVLEVNFNKKLEKLHARYEKLGEDMEKTVKELKGEDFDLLTSVFNHLDPYDSDEYGEPKEHDEL